MKLNKCHYMSFQEGMATLEPKTVDHIIADGPYFRIKGKFDFVFKDRAEWQQLYRTLAIYSKRILKDSGSMFVWGMDVNIAYQQIILDEYFKLINCMSWEKPSLYVEQNIATLRSFPKRSHERLLFYSTEVDQTGLESVLKNPAFYGLMDYFKTEKHKTGLTATALDRIMGIKTSFCYWDKPSTHPFRIPTTENYIALQTTGFFKKPYETLRLEYETLRLEYETLRLEYETLRRPFNNAERKLTDVLRYSQESHITKLYKHPTKKPPKLTKDILETVTRKGDLVVIPFSGSGTEAEACEKLGLNWVAFDVKRDHVKTTNDRVQAWRNLNKN